MTFRAKTTRLFTVALLCIATLAAAPPPSWAAKMGGFFEYTVYTKGRIPPEQYTQTVIVLLHGFLSAMPNGTYYDVSERLGDRYTVIGFNYDYVDVETNRREFDSFYDNFLEGREVIVVGTSLGGYWADYFANRIGARGVAMINPVTDPDARATRNLGEHYSEKRDKTITVTEATVAAYANLEIDRNPETKQLVVLTKDDAVLDYNIAVEYFQGQENTEIVVFDSGGHHLDLEAHEAMNTILQFIDGLAQP